MCRDCGHPAHARRCHANIYTHSLETLDISECRCTTRRNDDGDADGTGAAAGGAERDGSVRRGSGGDVAALAEGIQRGGGKVLAEIARIQAKYDEVLPLLEHYRDRLEARR